MKTVKYIPLLGLALIIFAGFSLAFNVDAARQPAFPLTVKYEVTVHPANIGKLCNTYLVEVLNADGGLVAPAQIYRPGKSTYLFVEQTRQTVGTRIARLVLVPSLDPLACPQELNAPADQQKIIFVNNSTYYFNLQISPYLIQSRD